MVYRTAYRILLYFQYSTLHTAQTIAETSKSLTLRCCFLSNQKKGRSKRREKSKCPTCYFFSLLLLLFVVGVICSGSLFLQGNSQICRLPPTNFCRALYWTDLERAFFIKHWLNLFGFKTCNFESLKLIELVTALVYKRRVGLYLRPD